MVTPKGKKLLASSVLALMLVGALSYAALPEAYCPLEDKTVKYIHMSDSLKTVTKVFPSQDEGGYSIVDDRCQKGTTIGQWVKMDAETVKTQCTPRIIAYTDNGKFYCSEQDGEMLCVGENMEVLDGIEN